MARRPIQLTAIAVGLLMVVGQTAGCSSESDRHAVSPATATISLAAAAATDAIGPDSVATDTAVDAAAQAAVQAWLSYDTRVDTRPNDTAKRLALPLLAPDLRDQVLGYASSADPGAEWAEWTRHHCIASVHTRIAVDDHPPDTTATARRQVVATILLRGTNGWHTNLQQTQFLTLTRGTTGSWLVAQIDTD